MIWVLPFIGSPVGLLDHDFRVSYLVKSKEGILSKTTVRRDGTFYGSDGYMWTSDGRELPFVIEKGKLMDVSFSLSQLRNDFITAVGFSPPSTFYVTSDRHQGKIYRCWADTEGIVRSCKESTFRPEWTKMAKAISSSTFRPMDEPRWAQSGIGEEYLQQAKILWYRGARGYQIGQQVVEHSMETVYGVNFKLPSGRIVPFKDQLRGLEGLDAMQLLYVAPQGWFVVEAASKDSGYLVWIEPRRD